VLFSTTSTVAMLPRPGNHRLRCGISHGPSEKSWITPGNFLENDSVLKVQQ
jgi:hypothetical protein